MTINERIIRVASPMVSVCVPDVYRPGEGEAVDIYCTFNYTEIPEGMADNVPHAVLCSVQLHLYLPLGVDSLTLRRQLRHAIAAEEGFTAPTVTNAGDDDGQHYVFEFDALGEW